MTLDEIEAQVLRELGDLNSLEVFWKQTDIQNWIYEAELKIARAANLFKTKSTSYTSVAGQANYDAPSRYLQIERVTFNGYIIPSITFEELQQIDDQPDSASNASVPSYWYYRDDDIWFYPPPVGGISFHIHNTNYPTKLTTGASSPTVPVEYHPLLVFYCLQRGKEMEEETQDAIYWATRFESELQALKSEAELDGQDDFNSIRLVPGDDW